MLQEDMRPNGNLINNSAEFMLTTGRCFLDCI